MERVKEELNKGLAGEVSITCRNEKTGEVKRVGGNLVVNMAYENLAKLLGRVSGFVTPIDTIAFGIGTTAAAVTDTGITGAVVSLTATASYPAAYTVKFSASWASSASSAADITEVGLFFQDNSLAARYVFAAMKKSAGWEWTIEWTLSYTV